MTFSEQVSGIARSTGSSIRRSTTICVALSLLACVNTYSQTYYDSGDPTNDEQLLLELINRSRVNPAAEGNRLRSRVSQSIKYAYNYFDVNLAKMVSEFGNLHSAQPLAMSKSLRSAAVSHSRNMLNRNFQGHVGSDGATLSQRVARTDFEGSDVGENVYAYAESAEYAHAGFEVDWGDGPNGMQSGRGHRKIAHNARMREVGVGVIRGSVRNGVGPRVVTEIFGAAPSDLPFILGVVYNDRNRNGFYDRGEGVGGTQIFIEDGEYYTSSKSAGGYAVPVSGDGSHTMRFTLPDGTVIEQSATVENNQNIKVDLEIGADPPVISGDATPLVGQASAYQFTATEGATEYSLITYRANRNPRDINGESGMRDIRYRGKGHYRVVQPKITYRGRMSYHLVTANSSRAEVIELAHDYLAKGSSELVFSSCIGKATKNQMAQVQVSNDDGATWRTVWSRKGRKRPQTRFKTVRLKLGKFNQQVLKIRFVYRYRGGAAVRSKRATSGWLFDNIKFRNLEQLFDKEIATTTETEYLFDPESAGRYYHMVEAILPSQVVLVGPPFRVDAH